MRLQRAALFYCAALLHHHIQGPIAAVRAAGTCLNPSATVVTVSTWGELANCAACANGNTDVFYRCLVNADLTGTGAWDPGQSYPCGILIDANAQIEIKGTKAGGGLAKIKGQGQSGGYNVFDIKAGARVEMEKLDIRDGYTGGVSSPACSSCNALRSR